MGRRIWAQSTISVAGWPYGELRLVDPDDPYTANMLAGGGAIPVRGDADRFRRDEEQAEAEDHAT